MQARDKETFIEKQRRDCLCLYLVTLWPIEPPWSLTEGKTSTQVQPVRQHQANMH